ncbi:hypothetical protein FQN50_006095 [Emmonsiellopsis sp. PD_5]|nr:hypothetical protein FQN50_006095 [Emmonsiellopsis sp. PD_5]
MAKQRMTREAPWNLLTWAALGSCGLPLALALWVDEELTATEPNPQPTGRHLAGERLTNNDDNLKIA